MGISTSVALRTLLIVPRNLHHYSAYGCAVVVTSFSTLIATAYSIGGLRAGPYVRRIARICLIAHCVISASCSKEVNRQTDDWERASAKEIHASFFYAGPLLARETDRRACGELAMIEDD